MRTRTKHSNILQWKNRTLVEEPFLSDGMVTKYFQVPYEGTARKTPIEVAIRRCAPREFFNRVYNPVVTKIDREASVVIVRLTHEIGAGDEN